MLPFRLSFIVSSRYPGSPMAYREKKDTAGWCGSKNPAVLSPLNRQSGNANAMFGIRIFSLFLSETSVMLLHFDHGPVALAARHLGHLDNPVAGRIVERGAERGRARGINYIPIASVYPALLAGRVSDSDTDY